MMLKKRFTQEICSEETRKIYAPAEVYASAGAFFYLFLQQFVDFRLCRGRVGEDKTAELYLG